MRVLISLLVIGSIPMGAAAAADPTKRPGIKGRDDRTLIKIDAMPWRAIGRVNKRTGGHCTGTLIGADEVLTAAHCLWHERTQTWVPTKTLHFVAGYQLGEWVAASAVKSYRIAKGYRFKSKWKRGDFAFDWAVLKLEDAIGDDAGHVDAADWGQLAAKAAVTGEHPVTQAGYSRDKKHILSVHEGCRLVRYLPGPGLTYHDCDTVSGDSGAPILKKGKSGRWQVIAVHVGTMTKDKYGLSFGLALALPPLAEFRERTRDPLK